MIPVKNHTLVFVALLIFSTVACAEQLLRDPDFAVGYEVMSPDRDIYTDHSRREATHLTINNTKTDNKQKPFWRLVQWGSAKSLAGAQPQLLANDGLSWVAQENSSGAHILYKRVARELDSSLAKSPTPQLTLELNALAEFSSPRYQRHTQEKDSGSLYLANSNQYWPHLLMVQNLNTQKLDHYRSIQFALDAHLLFDQKNIRDGYNRDLHAARFIVSMAVRNTLTNNGFWLNLVIYDDRYPASGFLCQKCRDQNKADCYTPLGLDDPGQWSCPVDGQRWSRESEKKGTRRMLFRLPTTAATAANIQDGEWVTYQVDLLPYIKAGIEAAQSGNNPRAFPSSLKYYDISLFSMGWEITGLNHAAMAVRNLQLTAM